MEDRHQLAAYPLRIDVNLRDWLAEQAKENGRSLNREIEYRLKQQQRQEAQV